MSQHFDLIVIGAGMAGGAAANKCAAQGWRVAIVDALPFLDAREDEICCWAWIAEWRPEPAR